MTVLSLNLPRTTVMSPQFGTFYKARFDTENPQTLDAETPSQLQEYASDYTIGALLYEQAVFKEGGDGPSAQDDFALTVPVAGWTLFVTAPHARALSQWLHQRLGLTSPDEELDAFSEAETPCPSFRTEPDEETLAALSPEIESFLSECGTSLATLPELTVPKHALHLFDPAANRFEDENPFEQN